MARRDAGGTVPLAIGASLAARGRPDEALPLIEHGVAMARSFGQPLQVAHALLGQARVLRALGEHKAATAAVADASSVLEQCPDPGILAEITVHPRAAGTEPPRPLRRPRTDAAGVRGAQAPAQRSVGAGYRA